MRKIFCILFVVLLLTTFCVPTLALGSGSKNVYAPLQFDTLWTGTNFVDSSAWIGNQFGTAAGALGFAPNYSYESSAPTADGAVDLSIWAPGSYFRLTAVDQIVHLSLLHSYRVGFGLDLEYSGTIDYSFGLVTMVKVDNVWRQKVIPFSGSWDVSAGEYFALGTAIVHEIERETSSNSVRIVNLALTFVVATEGNEEALPEIDFRFITAYDCNQYFAAWLNQFDMKATTTVVVDPAMPTDANFVDWLADAATGFLSAPLFGDFSIGGLLAVVISIGLVVALIKLFGG